MDFELPNLLLGISDYKKPHNTKTNSYLKHIFERNYANHQLQKVNKPYVNQTFLYRMATEQDSLPAAPNYELPTIFRRRSPSVENALKLGMQRSEGQKGMEPSERNVSPLKSRGGVQSKNDLAPPGLVRRNYSISYKNEGYLNRTEDSVLKKDSFELSRGLRKQSTPLAFEAMDQANIRINTTEIRDPPSFLLPKISQKPSIKHLAFGPNVNESTLKTHAWTVAQGVKYALNQLKPQPLSQLEGKQILLCDDPQHKKTLILDLDETLVTTKRISREQIPSSDSNEGSYVRAKVRPYAHDFLKEMSKEFEIIIFTAAEKKYAEAVLKLLDPNQIYISYLFHREHCLKTRKGLCIKDLRIFKNRDLKDMIIVDNFTPSFSFQINNGVPIITWEGDPKDEELKYLMKYLKEAKKYDDMRIYNKEILRLEEFAALSSRKFSND